ncbi:hypothetical protein DV515_00007187, partial [Chloebia gouldiae]
MTQTHSVPSAEQRRRKEQKASGDFPATKPARGTHLPAARQWSQQHHPPQEHPGHPQPGQLPARWPRAARWGWEGAATAAEEAQSAAIYGRLSQPCSSFPI